MSLRLEKLIFRSLVYFCRFIKFTPTECFNKLSAAFTSFNYCSQTIFNWYEELTSEDAIVPLKSNAGRQTNDAIEKQIRQFLKDIPNASAHRISLGLRIPRTTVRRYLYDVIGLERVKAFCIPHDLTEKLRKQRQYFSMVQLAILKQCETCHFSNIITGDESWFNYTYYSYYFYIPKGSKRPEVTNDRRGTRKIMIIIFFTGSGCLFLDALDHNATIDAKKMQEDVVPHLQEAWNNFFSQQSESERDIIIQATSNALTAGEQVILNNHLTRPTRVSSSKDFAESDRLMLPVRTSLFTEQTTESQIPTSGILSDEEENADNYHEEQQLPGYIIVSSDDDDIENQRASKRKATILLEELTQEELSFRKSLRKSTRKSKPLSQNVQSLSQTKTSLDSLDDIYHLAEPLGKSLLHMDNASPHNAETVRSLLSRTSFLRICHPPNSPDLAPSDFWLFGYLKQKLEYQKTVDKESLLEALRSILEKVPSEMWRNVFLDWKRRLEWVIAHEGDYYPAHLKEAKTLPVPTHTPLRTPQKEEQTNISESLNSTPESHSLTDSQQLTPNSQPKTPLHKQVLPNVSPFEVESCKLPSHSVLFANLGNTCYLNALLQCLLPISAFASFFLNSTRKLKNPSEVNQQLSIIPALERLFRQIHSLSHSKIISEQSSIEPRELVEVVSVLHPSFTIGNQADQHQLFQLLIDATV